MYFIYFQLDLLPNFIVRPNFRLIVIDRLIVIKKK